MPEPPPVTSATRDVCGLRRPTAPAYGLGSTVRKYMALPESITSG